MCTCKYENRALSRIKLRAVYRVGVRGRRPVAATNYESFPRHAPLAEPSGGMGRPREARPREEIRPM